MAQLWSLTEKLLSSNPRTWEAATQSPFLRAAADGHLSKQALGTWLANDRLYIHAYVQGAAWLLSLVELPQLFPREETTEMQLVDWVCDALSAIRKEERWFIDATKRYGLEQDLETDDGDPSRVKDEAKLPGLLKFEKLFASVKGSAEGARFHTKPWLEGAVILWGTERVYLEAWRWAKEQQPKDTDSSEFVHDVDGGASRKEL